MDEVKGQDWRNRHAKVGCSWFDHWLDINARRRGLKVTALLFLGNEGKSVAFIMSWEIDRNWSFEGIEDKFFLGILSSRGHWPHALFQSNILNLLKNSASFLSVMTFHFQQMTLLTAQRRQTSILHTRQLKCLYLHMWCFLLMVHIFFWLSCHLGRPVVSLSCLFILFFTGSFLPTSFSQLTHLSGKQTLLFS